ncbi:MAG: hypothetical protein QW794_02030 [Thermosphaera sp.]
MEGVGISRVTLWRLLRQESPVKLECIASTTTVTHTKRDDRTAGYSLI